MTDHFEPRRTLTLPKLRVYKNHGVVIELAASYEGLEAHSLAGIEPLRRKYPTTQAFWQMLLDDAEARSNWDMANYLAVNKLGYNDHGMTHAIIAGSNAIRIIDLLAESGVKPDVALSGARDVDDACLVTASAMLLHDIGNQLHRQHHELLGVSLARACSTG